MRPAFICGAAAATNLALGAAAELPLALSALSAHFPGIDFWPDDRAAPPLRHRQRAILEPNHYSRSRGPVPAREVLLPVR